MQMSNVQNWIIFSKDVQLILEKKISNQYISNNTVNSVKLLTLLLEKILLTSSMINQSGLAEVTLLLLSSLFFLK